MVRHVTEIQVAEPAPDNPIDAVSEPILPAEAAIMGKIMNCPGSPDEAREMTKTQALLPTPTAVASLRLPEGDICPHCQVHKPLMLHRSGGGRDGTMATGF